MENNRPVPPPPPEETYHRRRRRGAILFRRALFRIILLAIVIVALLWAWSIYKEQTFKGIIPSHDNELTDTMVKEKLQELDHLVTSSFEYSGVREIKDSLQISNWNIPGTTHTIQIKYNGTIKVGYEVSEIQIRVDNDTKTIFVTLPKPKVTDNYIDLDNLSYAEQNNVFNPIRGDEPTQELDTIMAEELKKAESEGIYEQAEVNAKKLITGLFTQAFDEYSVTYVS